MIREWEKKKEVKPLFITALTADVNPASEAYCLSKEGGFDRFLSKPLRQNVLRNFIVDIFGEERLQGEGDPIYPPSKSSGESSNQKNPAGASHCLIIDDEPTSRLLLRTFLTGMGSEVSEAASGVEGVEIVRSSLETDNSNPIELVFCDMRMPPGINGMETVRRIKEISGTETLPIIGMTADDVSNAALQEAQQVGMASLVSKPLGKALLSNYLTKYTSTIGMATKVFHPEISGKVFDRTIALENCGNDEDLLQVLMNDITKSLEDKTETLRTAVHRKDHSRVAEIIHDIKGMSSMCGFTRLANAAYDCYNSATGSDCTETGSKSQIVLEEITRAIGIAKEANNFITNKQ